MRRTALSGARELCLQVGDLLLEWQRSGKRGVVQLCSAAQLGNTTRAPGTHAQRQKKDSQRIPLGGLKLLFGKKARLAKRANALLHKRVVLQDASDGTHGRDLQRDSLWYTVWRETTLETKFTLGTLRQFLLAGNCSIIQFGHSKSNAQLQERGMLAAVLTV